MEIVEKREGMLTFEDLLKQGWLKQGSWIDFHGLGVRARFSGEHEYNKLKMICKPSGFGVKLGENLESAVTVLHRTCREIYSITGLGIAADSMTVEDLRRLPEEFLDLLEGKEAWLASNYIYCSQEASYGGLYVASKEHEEGYYAQPFFDKNGNIYSKRCLIWPIMYVPSDDPRTWVWAKDKSHDGELESSAFEVDQLS